MEEEVLKGKTLLVVDDEVDLRDIMASEMEFMGAKVLQSGDITQAQQILKTEKVDLIISDIRMPGGTGIELLEKVRAKNPSHPPVLLITGFADIEIEDALNKGAEALLSKPFRLDELVLATVRHTHPVESRFSEKDLGPQLKVKLSFPLTINEAIAQHQMLIGRGGICVLSTSSLHKFDVGEVLDCEITFKDTVLSGTMLCRWTRVRESGIRLELGLEFFNLDSKNLELVKKFWGPNPGIAYIPTF